MSEHPALFCLDAHAAGDLDRDRGREVAAHLADCPACADYVARMTAAARAFSEDGAAKAAELVMALEDARPSRSARARRMAWLGASLLAAAAVLLLVRPPAPPRSEGPAMTEPAIRFKGKVQIAVIRDRVGGQSRIATEVRVRPGDRLRAEISVDESRPIEVGFLGKDGTWVLLLAPVVVEAGTYFSEHAALFDETPTEGWIIAGRPEDVDRAKATRAFEDVSAIPVVAEP